MIYLAFTQEKMYAGIRGRITELLSLGKNNSIAIGHQDLPDAFSHLLPVVEEAIDQYVARTEQPLLAKHEAVLLLPDDIDPNKLAQIQDSLGGWRVKEWELSLGSLVPADAFAEDSPRVVAREIRAYARKSSPPVLAVALTSPTPWGINTWGEVQLKPAESSPEEPVSRRPLVWGGAALATLILAGVWMFSESDPPSPPISRPQLADAAPSSAALVPSGEPDDQTVVPGDIAVLTPDTLSLSALGEAVPVAEPSEPLIAAANLVPGGEADRSVSRSEAKDTTATANTPKAPGTPDAVAKAGSTPTTTKPTEEKTPTTKAATEEPAPDSTGIRDRLETEAVFPGGANALEAYLQNQVRYPRSAKQHNLTGTVRVQFEIDVEGRVTNAYVDQSLGYGCDEEALRLVQQMPDWQPATKMRKRIPRSYSVLVPFGE